MRKNFDDLKLQLAGLDRRHLRLALIILSIIMFVLGSGAPGASSDFGG